MIEDAATVEDALARIGGKVTGQRRVAGGCIAGGSRVELDDGSRWFVKRSRTLAGDTFAAEAAGLRALRVAALSEASGPRVPAVVAVGSGP
ncbi:MAG TPA: fructosamine kinase family protein, partial [Spirochaetia bacterium]|nr:fructosamine kinase family protein [Spirochaetia bacterium]